MMFSKKKKGEKEKGRNKNGGDFDTILIIFPCAVLFLHFVYSLFGPKWPVGCGCLLLGAIGFTLWVFLFCNEFGEINAL